MQQLTEKKQNSSVSLTQPRLSDFNTVAKIISASKCYEEVVTENGVTVVDRRPMEVKPVKTLARDGVRTSPILIKMFYELQSSLGVSKVMAESQIVQAVRDLIEQFPWLSVADVNLVFSRARQGEYGEMYERISEPKIFGWFRQYAEERTQAAEAANYQKHLEWKALSAGDNADIDIGKWYSETLKRSIEAAESEEGSDVEAELEAASEKIKQQQEIIRRLYSQEEQQKQ